MHTKAPQEPPDPNFNYETRDLPIKVITKSVFWFYMTVVISAPLCIWIMKQMGGNVLSEGPGHYDYRRVPADPNPLLQDGATAAVDMHNLRRNEDRVLHSEGTDVQGRVHIPIDRAIDLEAEKRGK